MKVITDVQCRKALHKQPSLWLRPKSLGLGCRSRGMRTGVVHAIDRVHAECALWFKPWITPQQIDVVVVHVLAMWPHHNVIRVMLLPSVPYLSCAAVLDVWGSATLANNNNNYYYYLQFWESKALPLSVNAGGMKTACQLKELDCPVLCHAPRVCLGSSVSNLSGAGQVADRWTRKMSRSMSGQLLRASLQPVQANVRRAATNTSTADSTYSTGAVEDIVMYFVVPERS